MNELGAFLTEAGADRLPHARGRTLLDHLQGTAEILRAWGAPETLERAALLHSVYGTDAYRHHLFEPAAREEVARRAGAQAERLAYLFGTVPRGPLLAGTLHWAPPEAVGAPEAIAAEELDALILLHMANLAEQTAAPDGGPAPWLSTLVQWAAQLQTVVAPAFLARLPEGFTGTGERELITAYRHALRSTGTQRVQRLAYVAAACPVLPEPCLWLASEAAADGDGPQALTWQAEAERRAEQLGTGWDKRVRRDAWPQIAQAGHRPDDDDRAAARFSDHLEALAARPRAPYPGLTARPFWDPRAVPLAQTLSRHAPAIIAEIRQLDATRFQPEAERIGRTGSWDVVFLYDRGRRHDDVCRALPTLARIVDADPSTIRSPAGLVYVSRMRAGTHIAAHRGPTNVRLRCHLGITVPPGDCAIRVERETRPWRTAECLVLDDHFEHEAWNHTDEDRIVVIADLWHPELSPREIELLSALDRHTAHAARRLAAYWRNNDAAQRG